MLRWAGSSADASVVECHFCTQKSRLQLHKGKAAVRDHLPIITGSVHHFLCPYCESWNIKNPTTGEFIDNVQAVHSDVSPPVTALRNKRALRMDESPFCHNCRTNQQLQVQLIAGYLPVETTSREEDELLARLPAYKQSLDARYPVLCPNCQERVDDIIKERNWKAKARTVGGWLKNSARLARDTTLSTAAPVGEELDTPTRLWLWRLKGTCWKLLYTSTALSAAILPHFKAYGLLNDLKLSTFHLATFANLPWRIRVPLVTIFFSFWDPTYRDRLLRNDRVEIRGKSTWLVLQALCYILRIIWVWDVWRTSRYAIQLSYLVSAMHFMTILSHRKIIWVQGPRRVKLVERSLGVSSPGFSPSETPNRPHSPIKKKAGSPSPTKSSRNTAPQGLPAFGQVSMGSTPPISRMYKRHGFTAEEDDDDMDEDDQPDQAVMSMDWQPFDDDRNVGRHELPDVDMQDTSASNRKDILLRPAVFNPDDDWNLAAYGMKGLDGLFAKGVSLEDIRSEVHDTARKSPRYLVSILLIVLTLIFSGLAYVLYPFLLRSYRNRL